MNIEYRKSENIKAPYHFSSMDVINVAKQIGIEYITSEACNISMRGKYKLNTQGKTLFLDFHGIRNLKPEYFQEYVFLDSSTLEKMCVFFYLHFFPVCMTYKLNNKAKKLYRDNGVNYLFFNNTDERKQYMDKREYLFESYKFDEKTERYIMVDGAMYETGRLYVVNKSQPNVNFSNISAFCGTYL